MGLIDYGRDIRIRIDSSRQPVPLIIELAYSLINRDVLRILS